MSISSDSLTGNVDIPFLFMSLVHSLSFGFLSAIFSLATKSPSERFMILPFISMQMFLHSFLEGSFLINIFLSLVRVQCEAILMKISTPINFLKVLT
jgi:hypothetical protein